MKYIDIHNFVLIHAEAGKRIEEFRRLFSGHFSARKKLTGILLLISIAALIPSCTSRFEKLNTDPNQVTAGQMEANNYRVGTKIVSMQSLVIPVEEHMYQFNESLTGGPFAGYIGSTVDTWLTRFETFNPSADWRAWPFSNVITEFYAPYRGIVDGTDDEVANAFANLFRVAVLNRVTDSYGPMPYSDALANESITVKYDSQEDVYAQMFAELDAAIEAFDNNTGLDASAWSNYDRVYYGDISKWVKYANSLKLRLAMRISYVAPETAAAKAAEAIAGGLILTNADNASMHPTENRMTLVYNDWEDHRVGADILCYMTGYNDPRLKTMFLPNTAGNYVGVRIGSTVTSKTAFVDSYSNLTVESDTPILWMNAAEVNFLLAEYYLRIAKDNAQARKYYEDGIRLSFEERGATGADAYIADNTSMPEIYTDPLGANSYTRRMSECKIAWDTAGDEETNLEQIITQKWIAIFPLGTEAWSEYRRTGYPKLLPAVQNLGADNVDLNRHARRLTYPVEEYSSNSANLSEAVGILNSESVDGNGDSMATRVWWDCKDYTLSE